MAQTSGVFPQLSDNTRRTIAKPKITPHKARKMLKHGEVRGHPLTVKQKGLFGVVASGKTPTRVKESASDRRSRARARAGRGT